MPGDLLEHLAGEVNGAAGAGRSEIELAGILLGEGDELRHRLDRQRGMNFHHHRQIGDQRQHPEIPHRIVGQFLVEHRVEHDDRRRRDEQRVAVGLGAGHRLGADRALRAGLVLDDDGLLQVPAEIFADQAAEHIGGTARGIGNHELDRARRIFRCIAFGAAANATTRERQPVKADFTRQKFMSFPHQALESRNSISPATICQPASPLRRTPRRQKSTAASP